MAGRVTAQTDGVAAIAGPVQAAGGVVERGGDVVLVHRPRYDDWSLPKGKLKRGEHPMVGAVREVDEETGVRAVPGIRLPGVDYQATLGDALVDKHVDFWAMTVGETGTFAPNDEVDDVAWLPLARALEMLSYPRDRVVLEAYAALPPVHRPVVVVRAVAGQRAAALAALLSVLRPGRLVSASPARCRETLAPLAAALGLEIEIDTRLDESATADGLDVLRELADPAIAAVVCPASALPEAGAQTAAAAGRPPDAGVLLSFARHDRTLVATDPLTLA
jgi:8-oxo-dGTP diphosphatase